MNNAIYQLMENANSYNLSMALGKILKNSGPTSEEDLMPYIKLGYGFGLDLLVNDKTITQNPNNKNVPEIAREYLSDLLTNNKIQKNELNGLNFYSPNPESQFHRKNVKQMINYDRSNLLTAMLLNNNRSITETEAKELVKNKHGFYVNKLLDIPGIKHDVTKGVYTMLGDEDTTEFSRARKIVIRHENDDNLLNTYSNYLTEEDRVFATELLHAAAFNALIA